jgi:hypothetical protein
MRKVEQGMAVPDDPDTRLTRDAAAAALTEAGFPVSPATLATKATRGGGPPFQKFGARPLYVWRHALAWAQSRLSPVVTSTSELDAATAHSLKTTSELKQSRNRSPTMDRNEEPRERTVELIEAADPGAPDGGRKA